MSSLARATTISLLLLLAGTVGVGTTAIGVAGCGFADAGADPDTTSNGQGGPTLSIEDQEASVGEPVGVPVQASGFGPISSISLTITYDPSVVSFSAEAETADLVAEAPRAGFVANVPEPGTLKISWFDASDAIRIGDEDLLKLTFAEYNGGATSVTFEDESEITNPDAQAYRTMFEAGEVRSAGN